MNNNSLRKRLKTIHIELSDKQVQQFEDYERLLLIWNNHFNLTAITEHEDIINKHFFDSLCASKTIEFKNQSIIDIGSGAGFPGIPLKICFPDLKMTLLESNSKKASFLELIIKTLELKNIKVINKRAEDCFEEREKYDIAVARAVASLPILLELCIPFVRVGGYFLAQKGTKANEELLMSKKALRKLSTRVLLQDEYVLPGFGETHTNLLFLKEKETSKKYPRLYANIKSNPL